MIEFPRVTLSLLILNKLEEEGGGETEKARVKGDKVCQTLMLCPDEDNMIFP